MMEITINEDQNGAQGGTTSEVALSQLAEDSWEQRYLKLATEFSSYKKRVESREAEMKSKARAEALAGIVSIYDDFRRLVEHRHDASTVETDIEAIHDRWRQWLQEQNIEVLDPIDEPFDYELHEAVSREQVLEPERDGRVTSVIKNGYLLDGEVLRHAKVVVGYFVDRDEPDDIRSGFAANRMEVGGNENDIR